MQYGKRLLFLDPTYGLGRLESRVLDLESGDAAEVALVVGDQAVAEHEGRGADEQVEVVQAFPVRSKYSADL